MRVAVPHDLPKAEVQRRMRGSTDQIADHIPDGIAQVKTDWASEDCMNIMVTAMGQELRGTVTIEDRQMVVEMALPLALSFVEPMVAGAIRQQSEKMLEGPAPKQG
ncbi:MAG: polyhydroxyalkanoic acid system family protein [Pontixanthobacter sp.]